MKKHFLSSIVAVLAVFTSTGFAFSDIGGVWELPQDGTLIQITTDAGRAEGFILRRPGDRVDEIDKNNPRRELRERKVIGLKVLSGLVLQSDGKWKSGSVYDPDGGSTYRAQAYLKSPERLIVRGYIGIPFLGRSIVLTRIPDEGALPLESTDAR